MFKIKYRQKTDFLLKKHLCSQFANPRISIKILIYKIFNKNRDVLHYFPVMKK